MGNVNYTYYLVNTKRPLEEKMALFWHHVFATGNSKVDNYDQLLEQIDLFRKNGMGNYRDLLVKIAQEPDDDLLARQQPEPRHRGERELGPRTAGAVQSRRRQLHREGRSRGLACVHRLDVRNQAAAPAVWPLPVEVRVSARGPRRRREGVPGPQGQLQRRGHHKHHRAAAGLREVHLPPPVQLLRRRRAAGAGVVDRSAARPGGDRDAVQGVPRIRTAR